MASAPESRSSPRRARETPRRPVAIDLRIAVIASRQLGVITRQQLLSEVRLASAAISRRLSSGRLVAVHLGVYRVAGRPEQLSWAIAATLACGAGAVVSGRSAADVHGIGSRGPRVEVTAPRGCRRPGIQCRVEALARDDVTSRLGVPVTSVARTVFDLAARQDYSDRRLAELVNQARLVRRSLFADLELLIDRLRGPGRSAVAEVRLRPYLADTNGPIRSVFEQEFRAALACSHLPPARFNVSVAGFEVDVLWPCARVVVELDGRAYHSDEKAFEADRARDAKLVAQHHVVIRITWRRWCEHREEELRSLGDLIRDRSTPARPAAAADRSGGPRCLRS